MAVKELVILLVSFVSFWFSPVVGHGRLWEPPGRSTMWRRGYSTPINYQDNELYCGGLAHQISQGYKCGVCGDRFDGVRENEAGGKYAKGIVTRTYKQGQRVTFQIDLTANHKGFFEFKICPTNNPKVKETQKCFDMYPLSLVDGPGSKFYVPNQNAMMSVNLVLPSDLSCDICVLQWRYHAGNNWGTDPNGKSCIGCGHQEEFYGCADIKILPTGSKQSPGRQNSNLEPHMIESGNSGNQIVPGNYGNRAPAITSNTNTINAIYRSGDSQGRVESSTTSQRRPASTAERPSSSDNQVSGNAGVSGDSMTCRGIGGQAGLDNWCQINCQMNFCPPTHCVCSRSQYEYASERPKGCRAAGAFEKVAGYDQWCMQNCASGYCPSNMCVCL